MFVIYEYSKYDREDWYFVGFCEKEEDACKICAEGKSAGDEYFYQEIEKCEVPNIEVVYKYTIEYRKIWDSVKQEEDWVRFDFNYKFWKYNSANLKNNVLRKKGDKTIEVIIFLKELDTKKAQEFASKMLDEYLNLKEN